jgi:wyosine [tRNA(Phe)-imidazoG37] synthetase (radical SAM superfamily)
MSGALCKICASIPNPRVAADAFRENALGNASKYEERYMSTLFDVSSAGTGHCLEEKQASTKGLAKRRPTGPFACPRDFLENRFVYLTISPRARGLSIGVNINPDAKCNFDCLYCEVDRMRSRPDSLIDCDVAGEELERTLEFIQSGNVALHAPYAALPADLLRLRHVALSGDGEPTTSPSFQEAVETVVHVRARGRFPFFKIVLITNGTGLGLPNVQKGLCLFTPRDEIWAKLDAGTQQYLEAINRTTLPLEKILKNILETAKQRPVIIQSLFSAVDGFAPSSREIEEYAHRLRELKEAGANIPLVQIYSATRPTATTRVEHLPLRTMAEIAATVRRVAGTRAEVF